MIHIPEKIIKIAGNMDILTKETKKDSNHLKMIFVKGIDQC